MNIIKKIIFIVLSLFLLTSCSSEQYWCDPCGEMYDDGNYHYVHDGSVDVTLCQSCYDRYLQDETFLGTMNRE